MGSKAAGNLAIKNGVVKIQPLSLSDQGPEKAQIEVALVLLQTTVRGCASTCPWPAVCSKPESC